jgi:sulfur relay (sulfurtransferase) DsrC/TusE family protein
VGAPPTYTAPSVASDSSNVELTALTSLDTENVIDDFDGNAIEFDQWFQTAAHLIEDEEDVELANAQLQKIRTYIEAYSAEMQNKLNSFNKQNVEYQGKLQESIQQAQLDAQKAIQQSQLDSADAQQETALLLQKENQEYAAKLQQFSADVGKYSAEVQAKVQDHAAQINEIGAEIQIDSTEYTWMSQRYAALKGQYDQAFGLMAPKEGEN